MRGAVVGNMGLNEDLWALGLVDEQTIDGFPPIWDYHESIDDLKHRLLYTNIELESLRSSTQQDLKKKDETRRKDLELKKKEQELKRKDTELQRKDEEIRRKEAEIRIQEEEKSQLAKLFKITSQERDELQMLLSKIVQQKPQTRGSSSITESGSPSYASSPILETGSTSPDLFMAASFNALAPNQPILPECRRIPRYDQGSCIINSLASKRPLPEKGKLLQAVQAVTRTTPLLDTLLMTGSLPEWRNPPPLLPLHIPPVRGCGDQLLAPSPTPVVRASQLVQSSLLGWNNGMSQGGCYVPTESSSLCSNKNTVQSVQKRQRIE